MIAVQCPGADDVEVMTHLAGADESVAFKKKGYVIYESAHTLQIYQLLKEYCYFCIKQESDGLWNSCQRWLRMGSMQVSHLLQQII
jgi:hypothetical protein